MKLSDEEIYGKQKKGQKRVTLGRVLTAIAIALVLAFVIIWFLSLSNEEPDFSSSGNVETQIILYNELGTPQAPPTPILATETPIPTSTPVPTNTPLPPTPTPLPIIDVQDLASNIRLVARSEFAIYTGSKTMTIDSRRWLGSTGELFIFVGYGKVVAGLDFSQMNPGDFTVNTATSSITINSASVMVFSDLPVLTNESYTEYRKPGWLDDLDPQLETQVRNELESLIVLDARNSDILSQAKASAERWYVAWGNSWGFDNVYVIWK